MTAGKLNERVAFDGETKVPDGSGGFDVSFGEVFTAWASLEYDRGKEAVDAGGLTGTAVFRVKLRSSAASRAITTDYVMRDVRRGVKYNIREIDAITDRAWIWLRVESGVAV
jgi:head-tail adaptor